ncbi:Leucine-rich repeat serine/threonine-protein kinase 1 [Saguinus oedipus]|uniref:Leucine-rich repeat serine/threonine-protein kinase 1 n=1 Tax=Saguinus oedipus TaxID=9490 RepID=A0ABQ9VEG2_SAGOE|nr:Leucine-rich repeat serine/threonine-protein kinase 1 [Saguinus oedipus]
MGTRVFSNPGLRELPPELGQLGNLWQLDTEDLTISNVPAEIRKEGPKAMLSYLRAQLRKAERCKLMKMIIVGPPRQGKSTLLEILQTGRAPQVVHGEATIRTTKWELQRPAGSRAKVKSPCAQSPCGREGHPLDSSLFSPESPGFSQPDVQSPGPLQEPLCTVLYQLLPRAANHLLM